MKRPDTNRAVLTLGEFCLRVSARKSHHLDVVQRKGLTERKQDTMLLLLLLLSRVSHIRLLATPWTAGYQAHPSVGFSRQEYWSGVPLPSPTRYYEVT